MNYMFKTLIAMLICMAALGTASAIIQVTTSGCGGEWSEGALLFEPYTPENGCYYDEPTEINVPSRGGKMILDEEGHAMWVGAVATAPWTLHFSYLIEMPDGTDFMAPMAGVTVSACEIPEPPLCDFAPLRPEKIEIYEPVEVGQQIEADYIRLPGNGAINSTVYLDGVESSDRIWRGESCIVVEALVNGAVYARNGITV